MNRKKNYIYIYIILGTDKDASNKQDGSKHRSNMFYKIVEQLTLPLKDGHTTLNEPSSSSTNIQELSSEGDPITEINVSYLNSYVCCLRHGNFVAETILERKYRHSSSVTSWRYTNRIMSEFTSNSKG